MNITKSINCEICGLLFIPQWKSQWMCDDCEEKLMKCNEKKGE